jgi:hypothetical protein
MAGKMAAIMPNRDSADPNRYRFPERQRMIEEAPS